MEYIKSGKGLPPLSNNNEPSKQRKFGVFTNRRRKETGNNETMSDIQMTQAERDWCASIGSGWLARDYNGKLFYYANKPTNYNGVWRDGDDLLNCGVIPFDYRFEFIKENECWDISSCRRLKGWQYEELGEIRERD